MQKILLTTISALLISSCSTNDVKSAANDLYEKVMPRDEIVNNSTEESIIAKDNSSFDAQSISGSNMTTAKASSATKSAVSGLKDSGVKFTLHFGYDNFEIDAENTNEIIKHANFMRENPNVRLRIEGHADERGTREYNLALGENRALAVKEVLGLYDLGSRVDVISFGEEKPLINAHDEKAYQQNRRVDFVYE